MKKFFIIFSLLILLLLSLLYLAVNSPYLVEKLAQKYAPQYHFRYDAIHGNPLEGITLDGLYYKGKKLARRIRLRINPYTLLQRRLTVSRLELDGVDVDVLEPMLKDFVTPTLKEPATPTEESGTTIPFAFALQNIRLSLLPFERYGVKVFQERLSVDSIVYDTDRFNVGNLHQVAETSLGRVELEGTYHRRFLDVKLLAVDALDLKGVERLIAQIHGRNTATPPAAAASASDADRETGGEDLFLPRRIRAKKLRLSLRPYRLKKGIDLERTRMRGSDLDIDLEHERVNAGTVNLDLRSNLGQARLRLEAQKGSYLLEEGEISRLDLQAIQTLGAQEENATVSSEKDRNASTAEASYDTFPFVPKLVEIRHLHIGVLPGRIEGVEYQSATADLRHLRLDLQRKKIPTGAVNARLETSLLRGDMAADFTDKKLHLNKLELTEIDLNRIQSWLKARQGSKPRKVEENDAKAEPSASKGLQIPYLPSLVEAEHLLLSARPFKRGKLDVSRSEIRGGEILFDLAHTAAKRGTLTAALESNLLQVDLRGVLDDNRLILDRNGSSRVTLHKALAAVSGLPLRMEAFSPLLLTGEVDREGADLRAAFHAEKILAESNGSFNVDIHRSLTRLRADFGEGNYSVSEEMNAGIPQTPLSLFATLDANASGALRYRGRLQSPGLHTGNAALDKALGRPELVFGGDLHTLRATLHAGVLQGGFVSPDLKKGLVTLQSAKPLKLARYLKLPAKLQESVVTLKAELPVDFAHPLPLESNLSVRSNLANIDGKLGYDGNLSAKLLTRFPKNSLVKAWLPKLRLAALDPLKITVREEKKAWRLDLAAPALDAQIDYDKNSSQIKGVVGIAGSRLHIAGRPKEKILATLQTGSVHRLIVALSRIYPLPDPKLDGDLNLKLTLERLTQATLKLRSKQFIPDSSARIKSPIKNIDVELAADLKKKRVTLETYHLETAGLTLFAGKPGYLVFQKGTILLPELWINDSLKVSGKYDLEKREGKFLAKASRFVLKHQNANLTSSIDIQGKINGEKIDIRGKILLLGGTVNYNLEAKHYATDEDIVIRQHRKKNEESFFRKNVQLSLYIQSRKPLLFHQKNVNVELKPQLSIIKSFQGDLQVLGSVNLLKGGYYIFQGKKFVLSPSSINFIGKPTQPLLDINLVYRRLGRTIYISVSGSATQPSLQFSSSPFMTREQILSFILFDTVDSGENAGDMLSMVGGGIAKSILGNIGLKVDTLIVTSNGFEVGKKITDKITVLYDQIGEEPKVIVRIRHSRHTETDISIGSESQSADIIYRKEF